MENSTVFAGRPEQPEAAWAVGVPAGLERLSDAMQRQIHTALLFGSMVRTAKDTTLNRVLLAGAQGEVLGTYDKVERMPFGEYLPLADRLPRALRALWPARASVEPGRSVAPLPLGRVVDHLFMREYMRRLIEERNDALTSEAEAGDEPGRTLPA